MASRIARCPYLKGMGLVGAGLLLTLTIFAQAQEPQPADGLTYRFVNKTKTDLQSGGVF